VGRAERVHSLPGGVYVLVGRDILNQFRITFDGPNQVPEFH
jgi:hypothetical protein